MGAVYKAKDTRLDRFVALKFLARHLVQNEDQKNRFIYEAKAASALDHPNICTIHDIGETEDGQMFIAMAYYEGETLSRRIDMGPLEIETALDIGIQIAAGLSRAHEKEIIHRDIKPANIIITDRGEVKIVDFGLAKLTGRTQLTKEGATIGTVAYLSPEQAQGQEADQRSDIWALGVVLYEMLTAQRPFKGDHDPVVLYSIVNEKPVPVDHLAGDVPLEMEGIINKCLEKSPIARYQRVEELLKDLNQLHNKSSYGSSIKPLKLNWNGRKSATLAVLSLMLIALFIVVTRFLDFTDRQAPKGETVSKNRIAILPFSVHGGQDAAGWGEGMVDMLSILFDGAGELRRVDPFALLGYVEREMPEKLDPSRARLIAEHFGAGLYVLGNVFDSGDQLKLTASLYEVDDSLSHSVETGLAHEDQIFSLVDELALKLLGLVENVQANRLRKLASQSTSSSRALKAFLYGEFKIRTENFEEAITAFQDAILEDSVFALAYTRMAHAQFYMPRTIINKTDALHNAMKHSNRLPPRDLDLLRGMTSYDSGLAGDAETVLRAIVSRYPDDAFAWFYLSSLLSNYAPRQGRLFEEVYTAAGRAVELDPNNSIAVGWQAIIAALSGDLATYETLTQRRLELSPKGAWSLYNRTMLAFLRDNSVDKKKSSMNSEEKAPGLYGSQF